LVWATFSGKNLTGFQNLIFWKKPDRFPKPVRFGQNSRKKPDRFPKPVRFGLGKIFWKKPDRFPKPVRFGLGNIFWKNLTGFQNLSGLV
jgi:predicted DNA-binding transcriptional regulator AlpA